jgi:hypothetical protein
MAMQQSRQRMSLEQYLLLVHNSERHYEYYDGEVRLMAGGSSLQQRDRRAQQLRVSAERRRGHLNHAAHTRRRVRAKRVLDTGKKSSAGTENATKQERVWLEEIDIARARYPQPATNLIVHLSRHRITSRALLSQ